MYLVALAEPCLILAPQPWAIRKIPMDEVEWEWVTVTYKLKAEDHQAEDLRQIRQIEIESNLFNLKIYINSQTLDKISSHIKMCLRISKFDFKNNL